MENKKPYIIMPGTPDAMLVLPKDKCSYKISQIVEISAVTKKVDLTCWEGDTIRS